MGGLNYNYCGVIPPLTSAAIGQPLGEALGEPAEKICFIVRNIDTDDFYYGRKQCNGYKTPPLNWAPIKIRTTNLPDHLTFTLDLWIGFRKEGNKTCYWMGGDGGPFSEICKTAGCFDDEVNYDAVAAMAEDLLNQIKEAAPDNSAVKIVLSAALAIVLLAAVAGFVYVATSATALTITGSALALGSAIVA